MTSEQLTSYLKNYQELGHDELLEINDLQKKYPWFSTLHSLEAKCFKNENRFGLKKAVKKASLYAGNREVLYALIHNQWIASLEQEREQEQVEVEAEVETEAKVDSVTPAEDSASKSESTSEEINEDNRPPKPLAKEESVSLEQVEVEAEVEVETEAKVDSVTPAEDSASKSRSKSEEINEDSSPPKPLAKEESLKQEREQVEAEVEVEVESPKEEPAPNVVYDPLVELQKLVPEDTDKEETKPVKKPEKKPTKTYDPLVELPKLEKKKAEKSGKKDFYSWLDSLGDDEEPVEQEEKKPRKLQMTAEASKLLDDFIKNRPSITRIRKDVDRLDVYNPARQSPENEIVSESLAELLLKQHKPEKAIEIYEKLSLQNPEKMTYFAALIEKIRKDNNLE
jgi:hypothetical protein